MTRSVERMFRGARTSKRDSAALVPPPAPRPAASTASTAYVLARANQHKGWARRWLKQNGHWV